MTKNTLNHIKPLKIPKIIILSSKFIAFLSTKWVTLYASKLFTTPIKHRLPKREIRMDKESIQKMLFIPSINRKINVYEYGNSSKKILLVHGWSGRGTQLCKIADELINHGYSTISFDAPAHGKSPGNSTIMVDFIASILEIDKQFGPFEVAIGHSLGGMSVLNAIKEGLKVEKAIIIGSGDIVQDITDDFIAKLELEPQISSLLCSHFEKKYGGKMDDYSAYKAAKTTLIPTLVVHDENDPEVSVKAGLHIYQHLKNGELMITKGLGHRKILADNQVIEKIITFIKINGMIYPLVKTEKEWEEELGSERYKILRQKGTEYPHTGKYNLHFENGVYCCGGCGTPLFESNSKFDAHCGWPSFDESIPGRVEYIDDFTHGMKRTEIVCANCGGHLGHVFEDGPTKTGQRYCVNSLSVDFKEK